MDRNDNTFDIRAAIRDGTFPTVTFWNRLEGRPRTANFDRALKAEVRDALWMLTRQWQMGEFTGDDAGSPVLTKVHMDTTRLSKFRADGHSVEPFEDNVPLEAKVERRPIPLILGGHDFALDIRLLMGRQWLKMLSAVSKRKKEDDDQDDDDKDKNDDKDKEEHKNKGEHKNKDNDKDEENDDDNDEDRLDRFAQAYIQKYPIEHPDPTRKEHTYLCAHPEVWQTFAATAGRRMDGAKLYFYLKSDAPHHAYDGIKVPNAVKAGIDALGAKFIQWFENLYYQPPQSGENAWDPTRLEYQFACAAPQVEGETVFVADEYYHGQLDWYNLDIDKASPGLGAAEGGVVMDQPGSDTQTLIPTPVVYEGMPNTRWWAFEDRKTNFGGIKADTTDLSKLMLIEFGLVFANDWFMIPYTLPTGSIARIKGMAVTNVFGERFWIEAAGSGQDDVWQRWSLFTSNIKGKAAELADTRLLLLPTVPKIQEGSPLEEVVLIRDEISNMVWGIETMVPLASGVGKSGHETAIETRNFYKKLLEERLAATPPAGAAIGNKANIRYQVMNTIPENWIPFIPVHVKDDNRETQLQRAALPRILEGDPDKPEKVRPQTVILREGLDQTPPLSYYLHEEEVPRAGVRLTQSFQRTRWRDGSVFVWLGVRKQTGRGEGSSGLAFDRLMDVPSGQ